MESVPRNPAQVAQSYVGSPHPLKLLGSGVGGVVFLSPDLRTAVKVHHHFEGYATEVEAYKRLARGNVAAVLGLTVPKMRDHRPDQQLIRMDFVQPPFLLDFAGVRFKRPDFTPDAIAQWYEKNEFLFGPNISIIYGVYNALIRHGIYYMDFRPSNINLEGLPDYQQPSIEDGDL